MSTNQLVLGLFSSHHLHELCEQKKQKRSVNTSFENFLRPFLTVKVHGSGAVGVNLLDHDVQLGVGQLIVQLAEDLAQAGGGDVSVALLVVQAEGLAQLLLHRLGVLLNDELGGQLDELVELQASRLYARGRGERGKGSTNGSSN